MRSLGAGKTCEVNVGDWHNHQKVTQLDVEALANAIARWGREKDLTKTILGDFAILLRGMSFA